MVLLRPSKGLIPARKFAAATVPELEPGWYTLNKDLNVQQCECLLFMCWEAKSPKGWVSRPVDVEILKRLKYVSENLVVLF